MINLHCTGVSSLTFTSSSSLECVTQKRVVRKTLAFLHFGDAGIEMPNNGNMQTADQKRDQKRLAHHVRHVEWLAKQKEDLAAVIQEVREITVETGDEPSPECTDQRGNVQKAKKRKLESVQESVQEEGMMLFLQRGGPPLVHRPTTYNPALAKTSTCTTFVFHRE